MVLQASSKRSSLSDKDDKVLFSFMYTGFSLMFAGFITAAVLGRVFHQQSLLGLNLLQVIVAPMFLGLGILFFGFYRSRKINPRSYDKWDDYLMPLTASIISIVLGVIFTFFAQYEV